MKRLVIASILLPLIVSSQPAAPKYFMGRVTGNWSFFEYGLGQDRLGGAKIGYIDTAVMVRVVDSTVNNYRVQLSNNHFAYIEKNSVRRDTGLKLRPYYLTNSIVGQGNDQYDSVILILGERLPYRTMQLIEPSRIVVDVYGVTSNTNWINLKSSAKGIRKLYYEQVEDDVYRLIIELAQDQHWGYSVYYLDSRLVIRVKRQPAELELDKIKIAIDAGHGGSNTGAAGIATQIQEKEYTLKIAKELQRELLDENVNVFMTRESDVSLSMNDRLDLVKQASPDVLISIHLNSSVRDSIRGVSTYYKHIGFQPLTGFILRRMLELGLAEFGNIGGFNFTLSAPTDYPNCLVEVAFLSNREDEQRILDPAFHKDVAKKIVAGLKDWLKYCKGKKDN